MLGGLFHKAFLKEFSHIEKCVTLIQHRVRTDSSNETKNARFRGCRGDFFAKVPPTLTKAAGQKMICPAVFISHTF